MLSSDLDTKQEYRAQVNIAISKCDLGLVNNPNNQLEELVACIRESADKTVGKLKKQKKQHCSNDPIVKSLSEERHKLRLLLNNNTSSDRSCLRKNINKLKNQISQRLKTLNNNRAAQLADEITSTDSSRRMFEAVRLLADRNKQSDIHVHDIDGNTIGNDTKKAKILQEWFEKHYSGGEILLMGYLNRLNILSLLLKSNKQLKN